MATITWNLAVPDDKVTSALHGLLSINRAMESTLIDVVAAYIPWLGSFIPASIGWVNVQQVLGFTLLQAWIYAIVVEGMGLATVATTLMFWEWNQEQRDKRAPFTLALATALVYLAIVLGVNVLLDDGSPLVKGVKALASSISVVGALLVAMRSQQAKLRVLVENNRKFDVDAQAAQDALTVKLAEIEARKVEERLRLQADEAWKLSEAERNFRKEIKLAEIAAKVSISTAKVSESGRDVSGKFRNDVKVSRNFPETFEKWSDWRKLSEEHKNRIAGMCIRDIRDQYGVSEKTAGNWLRKASEE